MVAEEHQSRLSSVWSKAAVLGSLWASVEIILGSFLHNIRFPMTGTLLSSVGVCLLVAGQSAWNERGLIWRSGLICALMKSISPSAMIIGPMVGIFGESLIVEALVALFGRNALGYMLGGGLAVCMPLGQVIVSLIIAYGLQISRLYEALFKYASRSLHITGLGAYDLIALFFALNFTLGVTASVFGMMVGKRARTTASVSLREAALDAPFALRPVDPGQRFSVPLLLMHVVLIPAVLLAMRSLPLWAGALLVGAYAALVIRLYPRAARRLAKPRLWIEFVVITALAGFLLGQVTAAEPGWNWSGFGLGVEMALRATFMVMAFSAVSVELRNPRILSWFTRRGLGELSRALEMGFQALPAMMAALGQERGALGNPISSFARLLAAARTWHETAASKNAAMPRVFIVSGPRGSGKTESLRHLAAQLKERGVPVRGILAPAVWRDGERIGYDLEDVQSGERVTLNRTDASSFAETAGPYRFVESGLEFGRRMFSEAVDDETCVVFVDEIGPLELSGNGWAESLAALLSGRCAAIVIAVREGLVSTVSSKWDFVPSAVWNPDECRTDTVVQQLCAILEGRT